LEIEDQKSEVRRQSMVVRVVALVAALSAASLTPGADVRLRSTVACREPIVRLSDVAEIRDDDPALAEALGLITLCPAPRVGGERQLSQHEIRQLLAISGIEAAKVTVTGSEQVVLMAEAAPPGSRRAMPLAGAVRQALHSVETPPERPLTWPRPIAPAATPPVAVANAKAARLVERGATVTVHSRKPGISVTAYGKALQPGAAGELIGIELPDSKQRVMARVVGPQVVEVAASSTAQNVSTNP
jgi:hypothetical protein